MVEEFELATSSLELFDVVSWTTASFTTNSAIFGVDLTSEYLFEDKFLNSMHPSDEEQQPGVQNHYSRLIWLSDEGVNYKKLFSISG